MESTGLIKSATPDVGDYIERIRFIERMKDIT